MKSFRDLFETEKKEYCCRVKTVLQWTDEQILQLEDLLKKYGLLEMVALPKTIMQANPMDFSDVTSGEVYMFDVVTEYPISSFQLKREIAALFNIALAYVAVRCENEPLELYNQDLDARAEIAKDAKEKGLVREPFLSTDSSYSDMEKNPNLVGKDMFGNLYNQQMLDKLAADREENPTQKIYKTDAALFNWLTPKEDATDFNADIKDPIVRPSYKNGKTRTPNADYVDQNVSPEGNFEENINDIGVGYMDPKTGKKVLYRKSDYVRNRK